MFRTSAVLVLSLVLFISIVPDLQAQDAPPAVVQVLTVQVKPTHVGQFEDFITKLSEAHTQLETGATWTASQSASGQFFTYVFVVTNAKWADLDTAPPPPPVLLTEAFGQEEGLKILSQFTDAIISAEWSYWVPRPDLSRRQE